MPRTLRSLTRRRTPRTDRRSGSWETVLAELAALGAVPDWVDVTPEGYAAPVEHDYLSGYDALRVPLYLTWSGNAGHGAVKRGFDMLAQADLPDHVAVVTTLGGVLREQSNFAGYAALAELASCKESGKQRACCRFSRITLQRWNF